MWIYNSEKAFPYECSECGCGHSEAQATCDRCGTVIRPELLAKPCTAGIHGVPKEKWLAAFANAVRLAADKDYFSDILFYDVYPDADDDDWQKYWGYAADAFREIFGEEM